MKILNHDFREVKRQYFRNYFQPSRIVIAIMIDGEKAAYNFITLCFSMHAAYKPTSMAFAVEKRHFSYDLLSKRKSCVLSVPGRDLASETLFCGVNSGKEIDKQRELGLELVDLGGETAPGLRNSIANIQMSIIGQFDAGDHDIFLGKVERYLISDKAMGPGLLSIGSETDSFEILAHRGIHRIAIPKSESTV